MVKETVILDEYVTRPDVPKSCAKQVYRLTEKELQLLPSKRKSHGYYRGTVMTLYNRNKVVNLACKKYGCNKKNLAEVLALENPPIVHPLIERAKKKATEKKSKKTSEKKKPKRARAESPSDVESGDCVDSDSD